MGILSYLAAGHKKSAKNESDGEKRLGMKETKSDASLQTTESQLVSTPVMPSMPPTPSFISRPSSLYPDGDFRNGESASVLDIKSDVMVNWLHQRQLERLWAYGTPGEGVVLKKSKNNYCVAPESLLQEQGGLYDQVQQMNVKVRAVP